MTISSSINGLFSLNRTALKQINRVDDYTVTCRRTFTRVRKGDVLAGARIVLLVTKQKNVDQAVKIARENHPVLYVLPFRPLKQAS